MAQQVLVTQPLEYQVLNEDDDHLVVAIHKHPEAPELEHGDNKYGQLVCLERMHETLQEVKPWAE